MKVRGRKKKVMAKKSSPAEQDVPSTRVFFRERSARPMRTIPIRQLKDGEAITVDVEELKGSLVRLSPEGEVDGDSIASWEKLVAQAEVATLKVLPAQRRKATVPKAEPRTRAEFRKPRDVVLGLAGDDEELRELCEEVLAEVGL